MQEQAKDNNLIYLFIVGILLVAGYFFIEYYFKGEEVIATEKKSTSVKAIEKKTNAIINIQDSIFEQDKYKALKKFDYTISKIENIEKGNPHPFSIVEVEE